MESKRDSHAFDPGAPTRRSVSARSNAPGSRAPDAMRPEKAAQPWIRFRAGTESRDPQIPQRTAESAVSAGMDLEASTVAVGDPPRTDAAACAHVAQPESHQALGPGRGRSRSRNGPRRIQLSNAEVGPRYPPLPREPPMRCNKQFHGPVGRRSRPLAVNW